MCGTVWIQLHYLPWEIVMSITLLIIIQKKGFEKYTIMVFFNNF